MARDIRPPTNEDLLRFQSKISSCPSSSGCLEWLAGGSTDRPSGSYGIFTIDGKGYYAHRVSYAWQKDNTLKSNEAVRHTCDNPRCCNPDHLIKGTHLDNMRDRSARNRCNPVTGDDHYSRTSPELLNAPKGDNHYSRLDPSKIRKGDKLPKVTKLPDSEIPKLKEDLANGMRGVDASKKYGLSQAQISAIKHGKYRK